MRYLNPRLNKTTFGFGKRTAAILEFYFRFRFRPMYIIGMPFCICLLNFVVIKRDDRRRSYDVISIFFKIAAGSHIGFDLGNVRPPTKCNCWSQLGRQIWS